MQAPQKDSPEFLALYSAGALEGQIDAQRVTALRYFPCPMTLLSTLLEKASKRAQLLRLKARTDCSLSFVTAIKVQQARPLREAQGMMDPSGGRTLGRSACQRLLWSSCGPPTSALSRAAPTSPWEGDPGLPTLQQSAFTVCALFCTLPSDPCISQR